MSNVLTFRARLSDGSFAVVQSYSAEGALAQAKAFDPAVTRDDLDTWLDPNWVKTYQ